jgi:thioredoxin 1
MGKEELTDKPDYPVILDNDSFDQAVNKYPILVVDCWAEWCVPCHMVAPVVEKLASKYKGEIVFGKLNVDETQEIAARFGIRSIPTLLIFKNGENVDGIVGALPEEILEEKIISYK